MSAIKNGTPPLDEALQRSELLAAERRIEALEKQLAELRSLRVEVRSEPRTYDARLVRDGREKTGLRAVSLGEPRSYVKDLFSLRFGGDVQARERLERHGREMEVEREKRRLAIPEAAEFEMAPEARAPTASYADPPLWLNQYFATFPRAERVIAALCPNFDLPKGVTTVNLPRFTAGTEVNQQSPGGAVPSRDVTDAAVTSNVSSFSGNSDWPIQSLEQSPAGAHLDWVVMTDATASYNLHLEQAILGGSGAGTSLLGLLNSLPSTYTNNPTVTYTAATPLATGLIPYLGGVLAAVNRNRGLNGEYWQLPGAFVGWLASSEDQQNRPLAFANTDGAGHFDLLTIPVAINNAITPTYSSAGNLAGGEQRAIMTRPSDYLLLESDPVLDIMEDVLSGTLEVRIQYRRSAAFLNRYPSGSAVLVGTGMIPASTPVAY